MSPKEWPKEWPDDWMAEVESERCRVALAEDDHEMRRMLAESLRRNGLEVLELKDGVELFNYVAAVCNANGELTRPDLLISDVRMPGFSGLDVLEILRSADWALPVIIITAFGDREVHQEARRLGAAEVFDKPLDLAALAAAARRIAQPARA